MGLRLPRDVAKKVIELAGEPPAPARRPTPPPGPVPVRVVVGPIPCRLVSEANAGGAC